MVNRAFLRSINIQLDIGHPDRLEHFRPTSKSARLISELVGKSEGAALFVVAPYGSGKSITAGYVGELIENHVEGADVLGSIERRIEPVDSRLHNLVRTRRKKGTRGLFVPLYGHVPSAPRALQEGILGAMRRTSLGRQARTIENLAASSSQDVSTLIAESSEKLEAAGHDRMVIVWDEFGRHLQGLISEGRPEELDVLQVLAEVVARSATIPVSLVLLLHRSLLGYASGLPSGVRREWAKIEGRFDTLQYLDDSDEMLDLVGSLVGETRSEEPEEVDFGALAAGAQEVGLFPTVDCDRLPQILEAAHPLEPATLHLLPRVAARVAQNERTLFSFLQWVSLEESVPPSALYDYFHGDFRTDGGPGGTQRPWLETESALQKVDPGSSEEQALKSAFLLGLGLSGERAHATYAQLSYALDPTGVDEPATVLDWLIDKKLLVHRRHSDQVVVWHGTDADLRGRLEEEKRRSSSDFRLTGFLSREAPPPVWRPVEYNAEKGMRRYLESEYLTVDGLANYWDTHRLEGGWNPGTDGRVLYVLPQTPEEFEEASKLARRIDDSRIFVAVAPEVSALRESALELWCLLRMHADPDLVGKDPLIKAELDHLTDDSRTSLQPLVDRVLHPHLQGSRWFHVGEHLPLRTVTQFRRQLSNTMRDVFPLAPEIDSEMVVRRSPSSVIINARKKVELGLLERYGQENLGIEGGFADTAIFRCVFLRPGLYVERDAQWRLATPEEVSLAGLKAVWAEIRAFFTEPAKDKSFQAFIHRLLEPPYGVREGLMPLLLAAGAQGFPTAAAIRHKGSFVEDLLPTVIEDICKSPEDYVLDVVGLTETQETYLYRVLDVFGTREAPTTNGQGDLLRRCMDAVIRWRASLPDSVATSRYLSSAARAFERELVAPDPVRLFLEELPRLAGTNSEDPDALINGVIKIRDEFDGIEARFEREAVAALKQTLVSRGVRNGAGVREQAKRWASHFPRSFRRQLSDKVSQAVLSRLNAPYRDDGSLVNALATLLVGRPIKQWDDAVVTNFRRQLRSSFEGIEAAALELSEASDLDPELREGLARLAEAKAATVGSHLADILGSERAAQRLEQIAAEIRSASLTLTEPA